MYTRRSGPLVAWASRSVTRPATGSMALRRQSDMPTDANEKAPDSGGVNLAFAMLSVEPRSGPYHGLARAPFTGLRVVATSIVGLAASAEASGRGPLSAMPAQPPSANAPEPMSPLRNARRDVTASCSSKRQ